MESLEILSAVYKVIFVWLTLGAIITAMVCKWFQMNSWND